MASPHVAGAAAVLTQAQPDLTPAQVRLALQATATRVQGTDDGDPETEQVFKPGTRLDLWQVGYGFVDLDAAVALVRGAGWRVDLAEAVARADRRVRNEDGFDVVRGDVFHYDSPVRPSAARTAGPSRSRWARPRTASPSPWRTPPLGTVGANLTSYTVTVTDPRGKVVGTTTESMTAGSGTATAVFRLGKAPAGSYTLAVSGEYAASDPDSLDSDSVLGRSVTLHVAQLRRS